MTVSTRQSCVVKQNIYFWDFSINAIANIIGIYAYLDTRWVGLANSLYVLPIFHKLKYNGVTELLTYF